MSKANVHVDLLINNEAVPGVDVGYVKDPGNFDQVVGSYAKGSPEQVEQAIQSSHEAFNLWKKTPLEVRVQAVRAVADLIEQEADRLIDIMMQEQGMLRQFIEREFNETARLLRDTADLAAEVMAPVTHEDDESIAVIYRKPFGVVACIVPWNAPVILTMHKLGPALIAGNTLIVKPSPNAPLGISLLLKEISKLLPPGVISVVHGDADVGSALTSHPLVRKVSFTGGNATAAHIVRSGAETAKSMHLELGGNDAAIILDDVDVDEVAANILFCALARSGQFCFATKRLYVHEKVYEQFFEALCKQVDQLKVGHPLNKEATLGPVNNKAQQEHVLRLLNQAKQKGARVKKLGSRLQPELWDKGYYVDPHVIADVDHSYDVVVEEQFGPIIPLIKFSTDEEALARANDSEFGLCGSVWSKDIERAFGIAAEMESGRAYINRHRSIGVGFRYAPYGGVKQSGIGYENGGYAISEYLEYHTVNYAK